MVRGSAAAVRPMRHCRSCTPSAPTPRTSLFPSGLRSAIPGHLVPPKIKMQRSDCGKSGSGVTPPKTPKFLDATEGYILTSGRGGGQDCKPAQAEGRNLLDKTFCCVSNDFQILPKKALPPWPATSPSWTVWWLPSGPTPGTAW